MRVDEQKSGEVVGLPQRLEPITAENRAFVLQSVLRQLLRVLIYRGLLTEDDVAQMLDLVETASLAGIADILQGDDLETKRLAQGLAATIRRCCNALRPGVEGVGHEEVGG